MWDWDGSAEDFASQICWQSIREQEFMQPMRQNETETKYMAITEWRTGWAEGEGGDRYSVKWRWSVLFAGSQEQQFREYITVLSIKTSVSHTTSCWQPEKQIHEDTAGRQMDDGAADSCWGT